MITNFKTNKLIVLNYPSHAGGKLLSQILALSNDVLFQDRFLAETKMAGKLNEVSSMSVVRQIYNKKIQTNCHAELGDCQLSNLNFDQFKNNNFKATTGKFWDLLTNQNRFYFILTNHENKHNLYPEYPNSKHIILKNYERILELRHQNQQPKIFQIPVEQSEAFDMSTVFNKDEFYQEILRICDNLTINAPTQNYIDETRELFLKTVSIGYYKNETPLFPIQLGGQDIHL